MKSMVYNGRVYHKRKNPAEHELKYNYLFFSIDLDELVMLDKESKFFGYNRFSIFSLHDKDYLTGKGSIKDKALRTIREKGIGDVKKIVLITVARYFNYVFNPVSFYYCFKGSGELRCLIVEVNNTFREKHVYCLTDPEQESEVAGYDLTYRIKKMFHVSPFNNMEGYYEMFFSQQQDNLSLGIKLFREDKEIIDARLNGRGRELTSANIFKSVVRYPITVFLTMIRIHKEAFKLFFMKKLKYNPKPEPVSADTVQLRKPSMIERLAMKLFSNVFKKLKNGYLEITLPNGKLLKFGNPRNGLKADMIISNWNAFSQFVFHGEIGMGESYVDREWDSEDVLKLMDLYLLNMDVLDANRGKLWLLSNALRKISFRKYRNTKKTAKKNIGAHYDLGNHLFDTFLDKNMMYSSGIFKKKTDSLERSQVNKIHALIDKTGITEKDHVLEIGSGWGGFAVEAVKKTGCKVTTITISREQFEYVNGRIKDEGLSKNIKVLLKDYRDMEGQFDKIISIEMLEAVGKDFMADYFQQCDRLLTPGGSIGLQVITKPCNRHKEYEDSVDWIQTYIFPGGFLPSVQIINDTICKKTDLHIHSLDNIGLHYVKTLEIWRQRFVKSKKKLEEMGYDAKFQRMWLYYLYICEAGFKNRVINNLQLVLTRDMSLKVPDPYGFEVD